MAPHSSTLAWNTPWKEEPGGLQYMGSLRVGHNLSDLAAAVVSERSQFERATYCIIINDIVVVTVVQLISCV